MGLMGYPTPFERRLRQEQRARFVVLALFALIVALVLDHWVYQAWAGDPEQLERKDWYQALRQFGYLPTWLVIAGVVAMVAARMDDYLLRARLWSGAAGIAGGPVIAGLIAEVVKPIVRRERPINTDGVYLFRPLTDHLLSGSGLGMPSSHAAVAFAGAMAIARVFPGAGPLALLMAGGCGLTRVLSGAHFLSDVVVGAMLGAAVAAALIPRAKGHL